MASGTAYPQNSNPLGLGGIGGLIPNLFQSANYRPDTATKYGLTMPGLDRLEDGNPIRSIMPYLPVEGPEGRPYRPGPMPIQEGPDYQTQFNSFSDTLGGFGKQMGGFGEQMGGFDKQFGGIMDRLSKIEEGIAGLMPQAAGGGVGATVPYGNNTSSGGIADVYTGTNSRGY